MQCIDCGLSLSSRRKRCDECRRAHDSRRMKEWRQQNRDRDRANHASRRAANPKAHKEYQKQYQSRHADRIRQAKRLKRYGITEQEFIRLWDACGGLCPIDQRPMEPTGVKENSVCVDHDHVTGAVRGLLCRKHNRVLSHFEDSPEQLRAAADYLARGNNV